MTKLRRWLLDLLYEEHVLRSRDNGLGYKHIVLSGGIGVKI